MKKLITASFLLAGILSGTAQDVSSTATLTSGGSLAGATGTNSAYYGAQAGKISTGANNTFVGPSAGLNNTTGARNVFLGRSGVNNTTGNDNTFTGYNSGSNSGCSLAVCTTTGNFNSFYGSSSGNSNNGGNNNAFFGTSAGSKNTTGSNNTYLGYASGSNNIGSGNVYIGANAGPTANQLGSSLSNTLFVDNSTTNTPLIWGDFAANQLKLNGAVGIGAVTTFPTMSGSVNVSGYRLFVTGGILTDELRVALSSGGTWADYVFNKDYDLKSLSEVENFIETYGHLPNVPSAAQVQADGINVADMARIQQEKIEELTLYIIQLNKKLELLEAQINK